MNLETLLRETIRDLAQEAHAVDLRERVLSRGRRMRRRTAASVAIAGMATLAVAVAVTTLVWPEGQSAPVSAPPTLATNAGVPPTFEPGSVLPDGRIVGAVTGRTGPWFANTSSMVWSRSEQRFVDVEYPMVIPAPVGELASILDADGTHYGLLDLATGEVQWLEVERGSVYDVPAWSPDGRYLAMLDAPKYGAVMLAILDTADRSVRLVPLASGYYCADLCVLDWHDADTVALPIATNVSERVSPRYSGQRLISTITGETEDIIHLPGAYTSSDDWSTDGRYVTLVDGGTTNQLVYFVYDTVERREVKAAVNPLDVWWVSPSRWLQFGGSGLALLDLDGTVVGLYSVPPVRGADHVVLIQP